MSAPAWPSNKQHKIVDAQSLCPTISICACILYISSAWNLLSNYTEVCGAQLSWRELCSWQISLDSMWLWGWVCRKYLPQTWSASWESLNGRAVHHLICFPNSRRCLSKSELTFLKIIDSFPYHHVCSMSTSSYTLIIRLQESRKEDPQGQVSQNARHLILLACRQRRYICI